MTKYLIIIAIAFGVRSYLEEPANRKAVKNQIAETAQMVRYEHASDLVEKLKQIPSGQRVSLSQEGQGVFQGPVIRCDDTAGKQRFMQQVEATQKQLQAQLSRLKIVPD